MRTLIPAILLLLFGSNPLKSQMSHGWVHYQSDRIMAALNGSGYANVPFHIDAVIDVDSAKCRGCLLDRTEPDNPSLRGCYLFIARAENSAGTGSLHKLSYPYGDSLDVVGVFRSGRIVWLSEPMDGNYLVGSFFAVTDLLGDGDVEVLVQMSYGRLAETEDTWVYRWRGGTGELIGEVEDSGLYDISDVDGDGVRELIGSEDPDVEGADPHRTIVYSWNGSRYGRWPTTPDVAGERYTRASNFIPHIRVTVAADNGANRFVYSISNDVRSKQSIAYLFFPNLTDSLVSSTPAGWHAGRSPDGSLIGFSAWTFPDSGQYHIRPGKSEGPLIMTANALPKIVHFFAQAPFHPLDISDGIRSVTPQNLMENIHNNSVRGVTIAPARPDTPFAAIAFLDSLGTCPRRSWDIGWIASRSAADKYTGFFHTARNQILTGSNTGARTTLQSVLQNVSQDSCSTLTSEAYALIRFNTEYLLSQLPLSAPGKK